MKDQLIFDTTDASTMSDSDSVGAYLRASDGTLITHTDVSGKKALDVRIAEGINVEVDLDHADDSVKIGDGTDFLAIAADGSIAITDNGGSLTVDAVDLDIRDLDHTQDDIRLGDGTTLTTVTTVGSDNGLDVFNLNDPSTADTAIANAANILDVADTAEDAVASPLANRKRLWIYNKGNRQAFLGATGVTSTNGFPLSPGSVMEIAAGPSIDIEWVSANTSQEIRTLEIS